jgi:WD40 repeat protein/serine/threonine protein kinase
MPDTQPDAQPPQRKPLAEELERRFGAGVDPEVSLGGLPQPTPASSEALLERLGAQGLRSTRYRLEGEIARGGMGAILKVWDADLRRHLAMKVILGKGSAEADSDTPAIDARTLGRFLEEAQVTGQLDHPGIVPVHELGIAEDGRVYFTMRLVKGRDLRAIFDLVFAGDPDWTETRALNVVLRACEALAYAHAKGVVHRDLKPGNVMVGGFGEVYVMDWGLARVVGREDRHDLRLAPDAAALTASVRTLRRDEREEDLESPIVTLDGDVLGTPVYMAPEQARGELEKLGPRSDVYAVGAILYHLLARQAPYVPSGARVSARTILSRVMDGPPAPLSSLRPDVPAELEAIVEQAMAREADRRYASTLELAEDLRAYLEHRVVRAYETGAWAEARKWVVRNRPLAAALAAAVVLLVAGLSASLVFKAQSDHNARVASQNEQLAKANERRALDGEARALTKEQEARDIAEEARQLQQAADASASAARQQAYVAAIYGAQAARGAGEPAAVRRLLAIAPEESRNWEWRYLDALSDTSLLALDVHSGPVWRANFSPDGRNLVTVSSDGPVMVFDVETGDAALALPGDGWGPNGAGFDPDGTGIWATWSDGTTMAWSSDTGTQLFEVQGARQSMRATSVAADVTRAAIVSDDRLSVSIRDMVSGEAVALLAGNGIPIRHVAFDVDAARLVTDSMDASRAESAVTRVWDVRSGVVLAELADRRDLRYQRSSFSPNGSDLVTVNGDGTARIWKADTGEVFASLEGHQGAINAASFSSDGSRIVTASDDGTARVWDVANGRPTVVLKGHTGAVQIARFGLDCDTIVTASGDSTARVWSASSGAELSVLEGHTNLVRDVVFSPDGTMIATASWDKTARIWGASTRGPLVICRDPDREVESFCFSPDATRIVTVAGNVARIWDIATGVQLAALVGHAARIGMADFSPDGSQVLTVSDDGTAAIWDADSALRLQVIDGIPADIVRAGFCLAGKRFYVLSGRIRFGVPYGGTSLGLWETAGGAQFAALQGHEGPIVSVVASGNGALLLTGSDDGTARIWDAGTGAAMATLERHHRGVTGVEFSADASLVATASDAGVKVWNVATGSIISEFGSGVREMAMSADGRRVVTIGGTLVGQIWDARLGAKVAELEGHIGWISSVEFSPDGERIVTADEDATVRIWDAVTGSQMMVLQADLDDSARALAASPRACFGPGGVHIAGVGVDGELLIWGGLSNRERLTLRRARAVASSPARKCVEEAVSRAGFVGAGVRIRADADLPDVVAHVALEQLTLRADAARRRAERLQSVPSERRWIKQMLGIEPWPDQRQVESELLSSLREMDLSSINSLAWVEVDPDKPPGDPVRALILARSATESSDRPEYFDTLAWALFRLGRFDEALAAERKAIELAPVNERGVYEGFLRRLEADVRSWSDDAGQLRREEWMAKLEELDREIAELEADPDVRLWRASQL